MKGAAVSLLLLLQLRPSRTSSKALSCRWSYQGHRGVVHVISSGAVASIHLTTGSSGCLRVPLIAFLMRCTRGGPAPLSRTDDDDNGNNVMDGCQNPHTIAPLDWFECERAVCDNNNRHVSIFRYPLSLCYLFFFFPI